MNLRRKKYLTSKKKVQNYFFLNIALFFLKKNNSISVYLLSIAYFSVIIEYFNSLTSQKKI